MIFKRRFLIVLFFSFNVTQVSALSFNTSAVNSWANLTSKNGRTHLFKNNELHFLNTPSNVYSLEPGSMIDEEMDQKCIAIGLNYEFYKDAPRDATTDNIPTTGALGTGIVSEINVKALQELLDPGRSAQYAIRYTGNIYIEKSGNYIFSLFSDDGSQLYINDNLVVDSDKKYYHGDSAIQGSVYLSEGFHPVRLLYFDAGGSQFLELKYKGSDFEMVTVPIALFSPNSDIIEGTVKNGDFELDILNGDWIVYPTTGGWKNETSSTTGRAHLPSDTVDVLASLTTVVGVIPDQDSKLYIDLGTRAMASDNKATLKIYINNILYAAYTSDQIYSLAGGDTDIGITTKNMAKVEIPFKVSSSSIIVKITGQGSVSRGYHDRLFIDNISISPKSSCKDPTGTIITNRRITYRVNTNY